MEFLRRFYDGEGYPLDEVAARDALVGLLVPDSPDGRVWLIEHEGTAIGYLVVTFGYSIEYHGRDAFVDELFIDAANRGRGIGSAVLQEAERRCATLGVRALHLEVERGNDAGQALYRKLGFTDNARFLLTKRLDAAGRTQ